jgi:hypothetical protein
MYHYSEYYKFKITVLILKYNTATGRQYAILTLYTNRCAMSSSLSEGLRCHIVYPFICRKTDRM